MLDTDPLTYRIQKKTHTGTIQIAREEFNIQFEETSASMDPIDIVVNDQNFISVFVSHTKDKREIERVTCWGISLVRHALREFSKVFALVAIEKNQSSHHADDREFETTVFHRLREIVSTRPIHVIPVKTVEPRALAQLLRDLIDHVHSKINLVLNLIFILIHIIIIRHTRIYLVYLC